MVELFHEVVVSVRNETQFSFCHISAQCERTTVVISDAIWGLGEYFSKG